MWRPEVSLGAIPQELSTLVSETRLPTGIWGLVIGLGWFVRKIQGPTCLHPPHYTPPHAGITSMCGPAWLFTWLLGSNSSLHVFTAGILSTELSPQTPIQGLFETKDFILLELSVFGFLENFPNSLDPSNSPGPTEKPCLPNWQRFKVTNTLSVTSRRQRGWKLSLTKCTMTCGLCAALCYPRPLKGYGCLRPASEKKSS